MIVRERSNKLVMITQNDHALISAVFLANWKKNYFYEESKWDSVELAIREHDRGWMSADEMPCWNEQTQLPFSFINFPTDRKLIFYKKGIDEVEKMDAYAGLLCSYHYARFTARNDRESAHRFVHDEKIRQARLKRALTSFDEASFNFHFDLLTFCDNLSLYACLNEPGALKSNEHSFFNKGLPIPATFTFLTGELIEIHWQDERTILMSQFPFNELFTINLKQRVLQKKNVEKMGILDSYKQAPTEIVKIQLKPNFI